MKAILFRLSFISAFKIILLSMIGFSSVLNISQSMAADPDLAKTPNLAISAPGEINKASSGDKVLAIVNGHAITQSEFDSVSTFPLAYIKDNGLRYQAKYQILRDLIDEYLIEQTITETKLDQDALFKPLLEREKRSALLNLYQLYVAARSPINLTNADIDSFIRTHREYFGDRRTYHYIQFILPPQSKTSANYSIELVKNFTAKFNQAQFLNWLIDQGIDFQRVNLWQGSEQMSPALLATLSKLKSGSVFVEGISTPFTGRPVSDEVNSAIRVVYYLDSFPDPINADEARKSIARNLITQANKAKISETMQDLRAKAKIEILDENLKLEITKLNQVDNSQAAERKAARRLEYVRTAWFFFLICLVPVVLWRFYNTVPKITEKEGSLKTLQTLEQSSVMRFMETLLFGLLLGFPLVRFIFERLQYYDNKVLILSGVCGIVASIVLILAIIKTPFLKDMNRQRFLAVTVLVLVQYLIMAF